MLHHGGLAGLGRGHDQAALALADGRQEIDDPGGQVLLVPRGLEVEPLVGEQRGQILEARPVTGHLRVERRHRVDLQQGGILFGAAGRPAESLDAVTLAEGEAAGLGDGDVDVLDRGQVPLAPQEAVPFVAQVEKTPDRDELTLVLLLLAATGALQVPFGPSPLAVTSAAAAVDLSRDAALEEAEGVHVLKLGLGPERGAATRAQRHVRVGPKRALVHVDVADTQGAQRGAQQFQPLAGLGRRVQVRLGDDFDERRPAAIEVDDRQLRTVDAAA